MDMEAFAGILAQVMEEEGMSLTTIVEGNLKKGFGVSVSKMLNNRKVLTPGKTEWTNKTVSQWINKLKDNGSLIPVLEKALQAKDATHQERLEHVCIERKEPSAQTEEVPEPESVHEERPSHSEHITWDQIVERLTPIIREIASEVCSSFNPVPNLPHEVTEDAPPKPEVLKQTERGGRRENRIYAKVGATIDEELFKLFEADRERRRCSTGRLLDVILWQHYGRPPLSFELPGAEERARARPKRRTRKR
jgi:hypothetical protein